MNVFILGGKALLIFSLLGLCDQIFMRSTCFFIELFSTFDPWSCPTRAWHRIGTYTYERTNRFRHALGLLKLSVIPHLRRLGLAPPSSYLKSFGSPLPTFFHCRRSHRPHTTPRSRRQHHAYHLGGITLPPSREVAMPGLTPTYLHSLVGHRIL